MEKNLGESDLFSIFQERYKIPDQLGAMPKPSGMNLGPGEQSPYALLPIELSDSQRNSHLSIMALKGCKAVAFAEATGQFYLTNFEEN